MKATPYLKKLLPLVFIAILLYPFTIVGQSVKEKIEGVIYDEFKKPIANVEVFNVTSGFVTVSDIDGHFAVIGKKGNLLRFTYPSKITKEVTAPVSKNLKVYFDDAKKIAETARKKQEKLDRDNARFNKREEKRRLEREKNRQILQAKTDHKNHGNVYNKAVYGQVLDDYGMPLPGTVIKIKGTTTEVQTDFDGNYGIDAKMGNVLIFSFIGYDSVEATVTERIINVEMPSNVTLDEVVVNAYRSTPKAYSSAAVTTVTSKTIEGRPGATVAETLKSTVPGIAVEMSADYAVHKEPASSVKSNIKSQKAGQLTAGEVNDFSKWEYWEGLTKAELAEWSKLWVMLPAYRYSIVLTNTEGYPIVNKTVHLTDAAKTKLWTSRTDNTGRAELWYEPTDLSLNKDEPNLQIIDDKDTVIVKDPKEFHKGLNTFTYKEKCSDLQKVNIAFMVDATGSMGDEIAYLQAELNDVINRTKEALPKVDLTMGSVFYRDFEDDYLIKAFDLTDRVPDVISFIQKQGANGGGDYPEAVIEAYEAAIDNMSWDDDARAKLLFVVLDAPPHYSAKNVTRLQNLAIKASEKGIRIIPIAASGIDKSTEYLMRAMALQTNGTYLFITNHSGIGNDHIAPSTDSYKVEMLNDLILRVIVQFTAVNDCKDSQLATNAKIEEQLTTTDEVKWSYYPNPTSGLITVDTDHQATALYLFDTTGKLVLYRDTKAKQYKLDLSGLPNAVYYLKVDVGDTSLMGKIIKTL
ncbi:carboxypeptidase-like regulatory domain-containing protein [Flavobacterium rivuli]|uniref:carboxypeptidase-like regulatory domain-containing protein n=1 Tax=Flavobacterium rivuli TaxID=498301 RepID=UPI0012B564A0|nr:carboxypeptidase-like regulatory domain-containing protein [Flavobacterium rivuli]